MSPSAADFEARVAALAGGVPVALLPVRLEARFVDDELRVRIFPDQIHLDSHEPELTADERDAGEAYWRARFAAPDPDARPTSPWADAVRRRRAGAGGVGRRGADAAQPRPARRAWRRCSRPRPDGTPSGRWRRGRSRCRGGGS